MSARRAAVSRLPLSFRAEGARVALRAPRVADAARLVEVRRRSWSFLAPWMPVPSPDAEDVGANRVQLASQRRAWRADRSYPLFVVPRGGDELVGRVALGEVVRGVFQNAYLGYWIDREYARRGWMTEAVELALGVAFGPLGLHRVQAAIIPRNEPSVGLARKLGFRLEGRAARYLQIAGAWEDHLLFAMTAEDWRARRHGLREAGARVESGPHGEGERELEGVAPQADREARGEPLEGRG